MVDRCCKLSDPAYPLYGGRGITVCDEWRNDFMQFYTWSINNGWEDGLTLDRINNDGNYEPINCQFTTMKWQSRNRRTTRYVE